MLKKATEARDARIKEAGNWEQFMEVINSKCLCLTPWCNVQECECKVKDLSKQQSQKAADEEEESMTGSAKTLCIPLDQKELAAGMKCFHCGEEAKVTALWGRSY